MSGKSLLSRAGDALSSVAPTVTRALGGPLAGLATDAVLSAFGVESEKDLDLNQLDGGAIAKLKKAELDLQQRMAELDIQEHQLDVQDRASARQRQVEMKDWSVNVLAGGYVLGYFALLYSMLTGAVPPEMSSQSSLEILLGALSGGLVQILNYYFGSSRGSKRKTEAMAGQMENRS